MANTRLLESRTGAPECPGRTGPWMLTTLSLYLGLPRSLSDFSDCCSRKESKSTSSGLRRIITVGLSFIPYGCPQTRMTPGSFSFSNDACSRPGRLRVLSSGASKRATSRSRSTSRICNPLSAKPVASHEAPIDERPPLREGGKDPQRSFDGKSCQGSISRLGSWRPQSDKRISVLDLGDAVVERSGISESRLAEHRAVRVDVPPHALVSDLDLDPKSAFACG